MKYNIYLDDIRIPRDSFNYTKDFRYNKLDWVIVRSYDEFIGAVEKVGLENINLISLDHDLADEHYGGDDLPWSTEGQIDYFSYKEKTGYDCAKWLCEHALDENKKIPKILVHSFNLVGSDNIKYYIKNFIKNNPELS